MLKNPYGNQYSPRYKKLSFHSQHIRYMIYLIYSRLIDRLFPVKHFRLIGGMIG